MPFYDIESFPEINVQGQLRKFRRLWVKRKPMIHPSAIIDEGAKIGNGTKVWHFAHVREGAEIGEDCVVGQNVYVDAKVKIGNNVHIQNNVSVYEGVILEDGVFCGPSMVFTNVREPRCEYPRASSEYHATVVRRGATLGANSTIVCGVTIGQYAFVAAGAVVTKSVPQFGLVAGVPARVMGYVCKCGTRLKKLDGGLYFCDRCETHFTPEFLKP